MLLCTCRLQILVMRGGQVTMTFLLSVEGKILTDDCLGLDSSCVVTIAIDLFKIWKEYKNASPKD